MNHGAMTAFGPQHMLALQRANEVRLARAGLKRAVAAGSLNAADVVLDCPWESETMPVADLLTSQRRWGRTRARRFLAAIPMSETKPIGSMTERQRLAVAAALRGAATVVPTPAAHLAPEHDLPALQIA